MINTNYVLYKKYYYINILFHIAKIILLYSLAFLILNIVYYYIL